MYTVDVRQHQASIKEDLRQHPDRARIADTVHSLPSDLRDPMRVRIGRADGRAFEIAVGLHPVAGGDGTLPCPGDVLEAALAACQELTVRMVAANMGLALDHVRVTVTGTSDLRGTLALDRATKVGIQKLEVRTHVVVRGGDAERARRLLAAAERYCSILDTLRNPPEVLAAFTFDHVADGAPADAPAPTDRSEDSRHG
jgi:uncharacterized OsmC-like protein